jgi:predicted esterase
LRLAFLALLGLPSCRSPRTVNARPAHVAAAPVDAQVTPVDDESPRPPPSLSASSPGPPPVVTDWCTDGLSPLDEDVCYVLPPLAERKPRRLLIYLHGIVPPQPTSPQKHTVESTVFHASVRAGAAALVPRGLRGIGPAQATDWWAWPTAPATHAALTPSIVGRWSAARKKLEAIAGAPFERTYLAGSSNGAYYLAALALRGDLVTLGFSIDGYGAMSGGASGGQRPLDKLAARPFYIGFGTYDDETRARAHSLATTLEAAHWPLRIAEHPLGHGANEVYLDDAFAFWDAMDIASDAGDRANSD